MIAVERHPALPRLRRRQTAVQAIPRPKTPVITRLSSYVVFVAVVTTLGGFGLIDSGSPYTLQARAAALHDRWADMRANGIPDADLAELEQEWTISQQSRTFGVAQIFWLPGGAETIGRWQAESDAIWAHDLARYRSDARAAELSLHEVLGAESFVERKARLDALAVATTPLDYATLRADWDAATRLVPIDARIATAAGSIAAQAEQAAKLGIRSEPASDLLTSADAYGLLGPQERIARAEVLTRSLLSVKKDLQGRLDAAAVTSQNFQHTGDEISLAALYGIDLSSYQARISADRSIFGRALTVAQFNSLTDDLKQIAGVADNAINVALSQTHIIPGVSFYFQDHPLSCEEAATSMALTHQHLYVSQDEILNEIGADLRQMYVDGQGRVRWGNPYETFVGNVNGSESNYTGFGTYYPPLVRVARAHGASVIAYGWMTAGTIYARVIAGHPVVAFATWDWRWHPRRDYLSFDGQWIPWIGPVYASHVYTVVGVSPGEVLINDPIRGQYWISKGAFEAGYSDFQEAIVFA